METFPAITLPPLDPPFVQEDDSYETFWMPLLMSCIAGGSTCLGAAVVFCQPRKQRFRDRDVPLVSEAQLSFSLSLAAAVMITVSVVSIGPECLSLNAVSPDTSSTWISIWSMTFLHRLAAFGMGCLLYAMLSCFAFPDADVILGFDQERQPVIVAASPSSSRSDSPLIWEGKEFVSRDVEKGGGGGGDNDGTGRAANNQSRALHNDPMSNNLHEHFLSHSKSTPNAKPPRRSARQRRLSRKDSIGTGGGGGAAAAAATSVIQSSANLGSDDDITTTDDSDDTASVNYEKSDNTTGPRKMVTPMLSSSSSSSSSTASSCCGCLDASSSSSSPIPLTLEQRRAWRVALLLFVSLLCHNFPEGLAVAASALESHKLGMTVTIGIMIHNIPEGIAIAVPCLAARPHQPWLAFWLASLSGLAEPLGAWISLSVLRPLTAATAAAAAAAAASSQEGASTMTTNSIFLPNGWLALVFTMENILAFVAGIMITVAFMDLFPEAWRHSKESKMYFISGTLAGITVMVATEWYLP